MHRLAAVVVAAALLAFSSSLSAQQLESHAGLRLRFESPGARSAAMGGASTALVDPFSAATNPASLARQRQRMAAVEARATSSATEYLTSGTLGAFNTASFETTSRGVRGAVVVLPAARATWALYYDEPMQISTDTWSIPFRGELVHVGVLDGKLIPALDCRPIDGCVNVGFSAPVISPARAELRVRRYGAAGGTAIGRLAIGGSLQYAHVEEDLVTLGAEQQAGGGRVTYTAGAQFDLTPHLRFGASYRSGSQHDGERHEVGRHGWQFVDAQFRTPSSYAAGLAAELTPNVTFAADAVRVRYSETIEPAIYGDGPLGSIHYEFPDVTELHAGLEYRLRTRIPIALRAGWWSDPRHRVQATADLPGLAESLNHVMLRDAGENHVTAGIGVGDRVRLDAAFDRSENTTRASVALSSTF